MAIPRPYILCKEVDSVPRPVTIVGYVEGVHSNGVFIKDHTGRCKLTGINKDLNGLIEVTGDVAKGEVVCIEYTLFDEQNFDFESHEQIVEHFRRFNDLF